MITELGKVLWANALGDATNGYTSTVSTHSATELKKAAAGWTAHQFKGQDVFTGASVGTILDNTTEVLTVARWENIGTTHRRRTSTRAALPEPPAPKSGPALAAPVPLP